MEQDGSSGAQGGQPPPRPQMRKRITRAFKLPLVSGASSALVLLASFGLAALAIPLAAKLPVWVEFEIVLCVWWAAWVAMLSYLLYHGRRVSDDYAWRSARSWFGGAGKEAAGELGGCLDLPTSAEGCQEGCMILLALALLVGAAWVLLEVAVPAIAFLAYALVRGMLARVANDKHDCKGHVDRAFLWAAAFSTLYVVPLAAVVWGLHEWMKRT